MSETSGKMHKTCTTEGTECRIRRTSLSSLCFFSSDSTSRLVRSIDVVVGPEPDAELFLALAFAWSAIANTEK